MQTLICITFQKRVKINNPQYYIIMLRLSIHVYVIYSNIQHSEILSDLCLHFKLLSCRILGWQPEKMPDERPRHERVVIIKYAFRPEEFEVGLPDSSHVRELIYRH